MNPATDGWELVPRGEFKSAETLQEGFAAIHKDGVIVLRAEDLKSIGVTDFAALLCQPNTLRLGIRQPREHEAARAVRVGIVKSGGKDLQRRTIPAKRALRMLGLDPRLIAPLRVELRTVNDALLILDLADVELGDGKTNAASEPGGRK